MNVLDQDSTDHSYDPERLDRYNRIDKYQSVKTDKVLPLQGSDFPKVMVRVASRTVMVKLFTRTYCG